MPLDDAAIIVLRKNRRGANSVSHCENESTTRAPPRMAGPEAIARAVVFAIEQPADVDVGEIIVRPTAQG